jgi:hypothetical protein
MSRGSAHNGTATGDSEPTRIKPRIEGVLLAAGDPEAAQDASEALDRALRRVQIEAEELLADVRRDSRRDSQD